MALYRLLLALACSGPVADLGAGDFATRERAERLLSRHADLCWPVLPIDSPDPEVRRRARRVRALAVPGHYPPVALLSGRPLPEWGIPWGEFSAIGRRPGPGWVLAWLRPDARAPLSCVVRWYGERARTQSEWRDWHSDADGREATRLLAGDLLALGVPAPLVRRLVESMRERELALAGYHADSEPD